MRHLTREGHLVEQLLLRKPPKLELLLRVRRERRVLMYLLEHLLVKGLREQPLRRLLLHHLPRSRAARDLGAISA